MTLLLVDKTIGNVSAFRLCQPLNAEKIANTGSDKTHNHTLQYKYTTKISNGCINERNGDDPWRWGGYSDKSFRMGFQLLSIFCPAIILTHVSFLLSIWIPSIIFLLNPFFSLARILVSWNRKWCLWLHNEKECHCRCLYLVEFQIDHPHKISHVLILVIIFLLVWPMYCSGCSEQGTE